MGSSSMEYLGSGRKTSSDRGVMGSTKRKGVSVLETERLREKEISCGCIERIDNNDSDAESEATDDSQFYHPISSSDLDDTEEIGDPQTQAILTNGGNLEHQLNPHLTGLHLHVENGIAALDLNGYDRVVASEEEEEATARERDASILRAFREDESRRSAPLPPESAARIVSVMRGVSFPDYTPEWVNRVPEERWQDHLRRLRGQSTSQS